MKKPLLIEQLPPELATSDCESVFACVSLARSHLGRVRATNEDAYLEYAQAQLWAVADGLGGLSRGDYASKAVVRALHEYQLGASLGDCLTALQDKLSRANSVCQSAFRGKRIGATVAALHIVGRHGLVLWAGDSRIYRFRQGQLDQLTCDHNLAEQYRAQGRSYEDSHQGRPPAHVLTRAVGVHRAVYPELRYESVQAEDRFLLCTDGAYSELEMHEISAALSLNSQSDALESLEDRALANGGRDNITGVVVDVLVK